MRLNVSQQLRLEQRMKLSPRIIQAMEILQLPLLALQERIEEEMVSNPVLEARNAADEAAGQQEPSSESAGNDEQPLVVAGDADRQDDFRRLDDFGDTYGEDFEWPDRSGRPAAAGERDSKLDALANTPAPEQSLNDYLLDQWAFVEAAAAAKKAGEVIISGIDEDGYLRTPLEELVQKGREPVCLESLRAALGLVQRLDPPGIGARDLRECLLIQLAAEAAAGKNVALPKLLAEQFLHEIEMNHIPQIAKRLNKSVKQIKDAIAVLARLDPRPGRIVGGRSVPFVLPDAIVELDEQGNVTVRTLEGDAPSLKISRLYRNMALSRQVDPKAREFIRRNLRSAQWLISAILQRRATVRQVIQEVFNAQKEFLERGPEALKPLPMAQIARKVNVHVATVSRAVAGKHVQTPRGIFPLRMFFTGGTTTASGQDVAWDAVKVKLKEVIDKEDKADPLDDDHIAMAMAAEGFTIARRTVAKYRNLLNISPKRQRRVY